MLGPPSQEKTMTLFSLTDLVADVSSPETEGGPKNSSSDSLSALQVAELSSAVVCYLRTVEKKKRILNGYLTILIII